MRSNLETLALCTSLIVTIPAAAAEQHANARLLVETTAAIPGQTLQLGVHFQIEKDWHLYWNGRNDSGTPIEFTLHLPEGWTAGPTQWPAPVRHLLPGEILDHVYEKSVTLIVPVLVPASAKGDVKLSADVRWLACNEACIAEKATVSVMVPVASDAKPSPDAPLFSAARQRIPQPLPTSGSSIPRLAITPESVRIDADGALSMSFFPALDCPEFRNLSEAGTATGPTPRLVLPFTEPQKDVKPPSGVLEVRYADKTVWYQINPHASPATRSTNPEPGSR